MKPTIFMYSGQGSQYFHMGRNLFEKNINFQKHMENIDNLFFNDTGKSVLKYVYDKKRQRGDEFRNIYYSHPAIFMQQYALTQVLLEMGIKPDILLGSSLGEYVAIAVSGVLSLENSIKAVTEQVRIFDKYCDNGGMIAILENPDIFQKMPVINENSVMAGVNYDSHFIVSGSDNGLEKIALSLRKENISYLRLPVSRAFHSSLIDPARSSYLKVINSFRYSSPEIPIISSLKAHYLNHVHPSYLWEVVRGPIQFRETIQFLKGKEDYNYIDLGPSGTLSNFVKQNTGSNSRSKIFNILSPFGNDFSNFQKLKSEYFNFKKINYRFQTRDAERQEKTFPREDLAAWKQGQKSSKKDNKNGEEKMEAFIFPGQGSQKKGMGASLFDEFKDLSQKADDILGYSIKELCLKDPQNILGQTQYTQPALFVVNAFMWLDMKKSLTKMPDFLAGHSLGEYNALFAADAFDFETGLKLVQERGRLIAQAKDGGMAAVVGFDEEKINEVIKENNIKNVYLANYNTPDQIVISGLRNDIEASEAIFKSAGVRAFFILNVSGAFHTPFMSSAAEKFSQFVNNFSFNNLKIPVISNATGLPYEKENIKSLLIKQIISPVKWSNTIRLLMGKGIKDFKEIGPGKILTGLLRQIQTKSEPLFEEDIKKELLENQELDETSKNIKTEKSEIEFTASSLGCPEFKKAFNLKYAYLSGSMYRGIASKEIVIAMGKAGMMGNFGAGGLHLSVIEENIQKIQKELGSKSFGMNLLHNPDKPDYEESIIDLYLKHKINIIEASAFMQMTPALVKYRLSGLSYKDGEIIASNRLMGKISRPEIAKLFLSPAPERIVNKLLEEGKITTQQADLSKKIPVADAICAEADSGGHTDGAVAYVLIPSMIRLRDRMMKEHGFTKKIFVGAAGGIGTPEAAAASFLMGVDFILTGSINQCTVEAGISNEVKDMLQDMNVQDTDYAPAGDMFEMGAKVQVLRKGVFFPARANKLYEIYKQYNSIDEIDEKLKKQLLEKYFKISFDEFYEETKTFFQELDPKQIVKAEQNPKHKMALIFRWYFAHTTSASIKGDMDEKVNFQIHTGPALGAFNQWIKEVRGGRDSQLEDWRNRHVDELGLKIMEDAARFLNNQIKKLSDK